MSASRRQPFWLLVAIALVPRLWLVLVAHPPVRFLYSDMAMYAGESGHFLGRPATPWDTFQSVGYPAFLALVLRLTRTYVMIGVVQAILGAFACAFAYDIARVVLRSPRLAFWAGLANAIYVPLIFYCGLVLTEETTCFFVTLAIWAFLRNGKERWLSGLAFGIAATIRPNVLAAVPLVFLWAFASPSTALDRPKRTAKLLAPALLPIAVASLHVSALLHRPAFLATNGGINFFLAHAEVRGAICDEPSGDHHELYPLPNLEHHGDKDVFHTDVPFHADRYWYGLGLRWIADKPSRVVASFQNVVDSLGFGRQTYWPDWPGHEGILAMFSHGYFWFLLIPAAYFVAQKKTLRGPAGLLAATSGSALLASFLFLGDPRIHVPFDPLTIVLALGGYRRALFRDEKAPPDDGGPASPSESVSAT